MRDADGVGDREREGCKTANNLIMSLSSLISQANDCHMQTHIKCKDEGADPADRAPAPPPLPLRGNFAARRGEHTPAPSSSSVLSPAAIPQKAPNASFLSL